MMIGNVSFPIFLFLLVCLSGGVLLPSHGLCGEKIRGVSAAVFPYEITDGGDVKGLAHDVMQAVAETAGFEYLPEKLVEKKAARFPLCTGGDMMLAVESPEIASCWERLGVVFTNDRIVVGLRNTPLRSLRDVRGKRVAQLDNSPFETGSGLSGVVLYRTEQYGDSLRLLVSGKVDYVVGAKVGLLWTARQMGAVGKALGTPLELGRDAVYLYVSADSAGDEEKESLRKALVLQKEKSVFLEIMQKYDL